MAKTEYTDGVSTIEKAWLDAFRYPTHDAVGNPLIDRDGQFLPIGLGDLDAALSTLIRDLSGLSPALKDLFYNGIPRVRLFGGSGRDGVFDSGGALNFPIYEFESFKIPQGQTVTVGYGATRIKVRGTVEIDGSLIVAPGNREGVGKAWFNNYGQHYNPLAQLTGSGGGQSVGHSPDQNNDYLLHPGGLGGGAVIIEALGKITIKGTVAATGGDGGPAIILRGSPTIGGSGGGSGGLAAFYSLTDIDIQGTVELYGGNGAPGQNANAAGGGGGAGGWFVAAAPTVESLPTSVNLRGGNPGQSQGNGAFAGAGGGGFGEAGGSHKASGGRGQSWIVKSPHFDWL